jgi:hypothetical protein
MKRNRRTSHDALQLLAEAATTASQDGCSVQKRGAEIECGDFGRQMRIWAAFGLGWVVQVWWLLRIARIARSPMVILQISPLPHFPLGTSTSSPNSLSRSIFVRSHSLLTCTSYSLVTSALQSAVKRPALNFILTSCCSEVATSAAVHRMKRRSQLHPLLSKLPELIASRPIHAGR